MGLILADIGGTEPVRGREPLRRVEYERQGRVWLLACWKRSEAYVVRHERLREIKQAASLCACPAHQQLGVDVSICKACGSTQLEREVRQTPDWRE